MSQPKQDADAFDDLLGQLVDELAMTPTVEPEPEPEPVQAAPVSMPGPPMAAGGGYGSADPMSGYAEPAPAKSNGLLIAGILGGAIMVVGITAVVMIAGKEDPAPVAAAPAPPVKAEPAAPPAAPPPNPGATPTTPGGIAPAVPGAPVQPVPGQPDPAAVAGTPAPTPSAPDAKKKKKPAKKKTTKTAEKKSGGGFEDL